MPTSLLETGTQSSTEENPAIASPSASPQQEPAPPSSSPPEEEWLFSARCESARVVSTLLSCLRLVSSATAAAANRDDPTPRQQPPPRKNSLIQPVTVFCCPSSVTFHVYGTACQSQASVDMQATLFSDYKLFKQPNADEAAAAGGEFCVNLTTVLDCLHVLGTQNLERTKLCLSYNLTDEIFKMELLEEGILSTTAIPGMLPPEDNGTSLSLAFRSTPIVARMIVKSESLREAMQELELVHGATCCAVALGPNGLELAAAGHIGECLIQLPSGGASIVQLDCTEMVARTYLLHSLKSGMRGLEIAEETCMSINEVGMIAIQHQVLDNLTQGPPSYVDFIMSCLEDDDTDRSSQDQASQKDASVSAPSSTMGWDDDHANTRATRSATTRPLMVDDDDENGSDDDDALPPRPASAAPLFRTVATETTNRSVRRRRADRSSHGNRDSGESASIPSDRTDDESDQEQDVAAPTTPSRRQRLAAEQEEGSSSPEIVYDEG